MKTSNFKILMTVKGIVTISFGVGVVLIPAIIFSLFGMALSPGGLLISRLFGAALLIIGMQVYVSRNALPSKELRASMFAASLGDIIAFIVILSAQMQGVMNTIGWLLVIIYILSAVLFTYFFFAMAQRVQ